LDQALGIGGVPRGHLTEILGVPTSGMTTLALKVISQAQAQGDTAAYVDLGGTFDPDYAARCQVRLARLLLARPSTGVKALEIIQDLVTSGGVGVVAFDGVSHLLTETSGAQTLTAALRRLLPGLTQSPCALICLTSLPVGDAPTAVNNIPRSALSSFATVRLWLQKEHWLYQRKRLWGYQAQVQIAKNKLGQAGQRVSVAITFNGTVQGDGT
jgi:recombination protein RecA